MSVSAISLSFLQPVVFGLLEKDLLCATMAVTTTMGVDLGFSWGVSF